MAQSGRALDFRSKGCLVQDSPDIFIDIFI